MKPFDLEKALAGEPVKLRNGNKAYVKYMLHAPRSTYPVRGYRLSRNGEFEHTSAWTELGKFSDYDDLHELDIIGMWQESRPRVQLDLPAPLKSLDGLTIVYCPVLDKDMQGNVISKIYEFHEVIFQEKSIQGQLENGNLFSTKEDAQEWLDAQKGARR